MPGSVTELWRGLGVVLAADRDRWALWLPVAMAAGAVVYYALPVEPPVWPAAAGAAFLAGLWLGRGVPGPLRIPILATLAVAAGLLAGHVRTALVDAPMVSGEVGPALVGGRVVAIERLESGARLILTAPEIPGVPPSDTPARIRLKIHDPVPPQVGAQIQVRAVVMGPSGPVLPGGFDFRRYLYFQQIGGIGYAVGAVQTLAPGTPGTAPLEAWREAIAAKIHQTLDPPVAAVAAALLVGERTAIPDEVTRALRDSGLAHLLAISGLHIGLAAGFVFFVVRGGLALVPSIALRRPIKKWAAAAALVAAFGYMLLVGAPVPTQRAFLMTGLVLLAILIDRTAISMRLVAIAALVVIAVSPDSVVGPSFQMSFAAVIALVAVYEAVRHRALDWRGDHGVLARILWYFGGVLLTSLIASAATSIFALYHFQRIATYGLVANLVAVPLTAFWIMPSGLIAYALMPFGWERVALEPMGWGIAVLIRIAEAAAGWPGAVWTVPSMPAWGLACCALGGIWLCLWRQRWRWLGGFGLALGLASIAVTPRPDLLIGEGARLIAVRHADGHLSVSTLRRERFARDIWLSANGQEEAPSWSRDGVATGDGRLRCDGQGCVYRAGDRVIALPTDPLAAAEDCATADLVVADFPLWSVCQGPPTLDRIDLYRTGPTAVFVDADGVRLETVQHQSYGRPWSAYGPVARDPLAR